MITKLNRLFCTVTPTMVQILNVAEKNDAARTLSEIMSAGRYTRREGISKFNKIYEFEYNILNRRSSMIMTSLSGHLMNYEFVALYKNWNGCNPVSLFDAPMQKNILQNYEGIKRTLEREIRKCEILIIWTDCDREGENIGFEIIQVCKNVKPHIKIYRARFSEITPTSVSNACNNLTILNQNLSDAVDVRQELDLRIGASFTRFQTLRLQKIFPQALADQLISYGPCQFPTLGFVVERYKQVQAFVPETFWKIKVSHQIEEGEIEFNWQRIRLFDHTACLILYQICIENPIATVIHIESRNKSKWRPLPLETVELEKTASRKLHITAKETMKIAEKLYTQGFISYPRTETNIFPKDLDLSPIIQMQTMDPNWGVFATNLFNVGPTPRNGTKTDNAHPPIYPTKYTNNLQGNEKQVYDFIVRHFLACCSQDAEGKETTVKIDIAGETFIAQGLMILARNYLDVYPYDRWNAKVIPVFEMGESFQPTVIRMVDGDTTPPPLLTEADLIALMEKHGIGTDATYAEHIETIKSRMYVGVRDDGRFVPGELGMGLVEGYDAMGQELSKPHLRAELESDLKRISEGVKNKNVVLREYIDKYRNIFIQAANMANKIDEALSQYLGAAETFQPPADQTPTYSPVRKCPQCNQDMVLMKKTNKPGFYVSCVNFPKCRSVIWLPEAIVDASVTSSTCDICGPQPVYLLKIIFKRNSVPSFVPLEYIGCISGCDEMLREYLNIQLHCSLPDNAPANKSGSQSRMPVSMGRGRTPGSVNQSRTSGSVSQLRTSESVSHSRTSGTEDQSRTFRPAVQPKTSGQVNLMKMAGPVNYSNVGGTINQSWINNRNCNNNFRINDNLNDHMSNNIIQPSSNQEIDHQSLRNVSHHPLPSSSSVQGPVVCNCGDDGLLLTVKKEGPNLGRQFYKCAKPQGSGCNFFLWADSSPVSNPNENRFPNINNTRTPNQNPVSTSSDHGTVVCNCDEDALLLTVRKEGPNSGRQFYKCAKPQGSGCNFFLWADSASGQNSENDDRFVNNKDTRSSNFPQKDSSGIVCNCNQSSIRVTVQKEGQNKGRQFFSCPKPFGEKCNFFKWADDQTNPQFSDQNYAANFSNTSQGQSRQSSVKKRKCGVCGQEGHNKRNCPVANS